MVLFYLYIHVIFSNQFAVGKTVEKIFIHHAKYHGGSNNPDLASVFTSDNSYQV